VFCGLGYKILNGGTLHVPDEFNKKKKVQKQQFNMPNVWGVQSMNKKENKTKTGLERVAKKKKSHVKKKTQSQGAWKCPNCDEFTIGNQCRSCGYKK
jgi:ABC-type ATPase with predicted acetyltransferase domain